MAWGMGIMWWKLAGLGLIECALVGLLFVPIPAPAVVIEVDRATGIAAPLIDWPMVLANLTSTAFILAVSALPMWMAYRVIRGRRSPS